MDDKNLVYGLMVAMTYILFSLVVKMVENPEKRKVIHKTLLFIYTVFYGAVMYSCIKYVI